MAVKQPLCNYGGLLKELQVGDTLPGGGSSGITVGTTTITSGTSGRIAFNNGGIYGENSNLFWDNTNSRLGLGITPTEILHVSGRSIFDNTGGGAFSSGVIINGADATYMTDWKKAGTTIVTMYADGGGTQLGFSNLNGTVVGNSVPLTIRTSGAANNLSIISNADIIMTPTGGVGIGTASPTAKVHIKAGTAAANTAPLKLTAGVALGTPEDGALEYHTSHLYFTIGSNRYQLDQQSGGGSFTLITVEVDLGTIPRTSGSFTITSTGLTPSKSVSIQQAVAPYTGKGTLADETEMDMLTVTGATTSTTNIQCYWNSPTFVKGNFKFNYIISA